MIGIYCIENTITHQRYVGQSIQLETRKKNHFCELNRGVHKNPYLQASFNEYGSSAFKFTILECCDESELSDKERKWMNHFGGYKSDNLFNILEGGSENIGSSNPLYGKSRSVETKMKLSKSLKGRASPNKGKTFSAEHKKKLSESKKGKMTGENNPMYGKPSPNRGKSMSEETKRKMSEARKAYWQRKKNCTGDLQISGTMEVCL